MLNARHLIRSLRERSFLVLRTGFRMVPLGESRRDRWREWFLQHFPDVRPAAVQGQSSGATPLRRARATANGKAVGYRSHQTGALPATPPARLVAFYLPQFHAIPENDEWWGEGFTEWRNVGRALPQFQGHAQPRLPGALGYYDLTHPETLRAQATLAQAYGVAAFCCYFYWFQGKTLFEAPLRQWLDDQSITLPICLCWANESWARRWDGRAGEILMQQQHNPDDDVAFISHVSAYLRDPRYLRVDGKPVVLVYRPGLMPDPAATAARWRQWCANNGLGEIFIAYVQGFERPDPATLGFDAAVEFPPNLSTPADITADQVLINDGYTGQVLDWRELAAGYSRRPPPAYRVFPAVNCGWDNEPRRPAQGRTYLHASPRRYRDWLVAAIARVSADTLEVAQRDAPLVFINAWNEWAEGAVLEPDARLGHAWLHATSEALRASVATPKATDAVASLRPCVVIHAWYPDAFGDLLDALRETTTQMRLVVTTGKGQAESVSAELARRGMSAEVEVHENRGRDILPFLRVADRLLDEGETLVLKLHTKQSPHRRDGANWRGELLDRLASPARVGQIVAAFQEYPSLGMVAPEGHVQPLHYYWGANRDNVRYLATRLGIRQPDAETDQFVSGSMFWVRLEALRPLLDAHLDEWEFETESGQLDGTFAHAVERVFALCVREHGLQVEDAATLCGGAHVDNGRYQYAKRD
ncbi:glycoside hydrolase family 99-like domain-containing protein [Lysobacter sp. H23M47]|uniref:glycoside hydrolase family 99-like domain-containing protein n=1 Tax=Lysobacter sp. H23M47 TaxID=2781024 RepID=UPI001881181E|nr:glycoside hydrolase family 99-like domain-containing protein [Lysobacter sp. H23M47]QOW24143.1 glycoside hydrolase family 99-like domain-containing protein [Lysobacter sp. H23M47]